MLWDSALVWGIGIWCGLSANGEGIGIWCGVSAYGVGYRHMDCGFDIGCWVAAFDVGYRHMFWDICLWCGYRHRLIVSAYVVRGRHKLWVS